MFIAFFNAWKEWRLTGELIRNNLRAVVKAF